MNIFKPNVLLFGTQCMSSFCFRFFILELNKSSVSIQSEEHLSQIVQTSYLHFLCIFIRTEARINLNSDCFFYRSFDVRGRSFAKALLWSDQNSFGSRAYFVTVSRPAGLTVDNIHLDDEGVSSRFI